MISTQAQTIFAKVHASDVVEASEPAWARSLFVKEASWAHHASVMQRIKIVAGLDIEDRVPSIIRPVLLVRGAEDTFTGHTTARLRSLLRHVDVVTLPGGHLPHVTSSLAFARVVQDFLFALQFYDMARKDPSELKLLMGDIYTKPWAEMDIAEVEDKLEIRTKIWKLWKNPFFNTTDVDLALTSTGYVSEVALKPLQDGDDNVAVAAAIAGYARMRHQYAPYPILEADG